MLKLCTCLSVDGITSISVLLKLIKSVVSLAMLSDLLLHNSVLLSDVTP